MDIETFGAAIATINRMANTAAGRAEAAATTAAAAAGSAETSAALAAQRAMAVSVSGKALVFTSAET